MKKFLLLYVGLWQPTDEMKEAWGAWFAKVGDKFTDSGNPFSPGKDVTPKGVRDLPHDKHAIVGYSIIKAAGMDEAVKIAQSCPMITSVRVYEAVTM